MKKQNEIYDDKTEEINNVKKQIDELNNKLIEVNTKIKSYTVILDLLKDTGVKSVIIKSYLTPINLLMKKYLDMIGFNVSFQFDENFNETIKSRNRDVFEYGCFSEGEKLKIDLSLLFTFRELAKLRSSIHTNLLFIDECIDGRFDNDSVQTLNTLFEQINDNVFIISHHAEQYAQIINKHIHVEKKNNFSVVKETKE